MNKTKNTEIRGTDGTVIPAVFTGERTQKTVLVAHGICGDKNEWYDTSARIAEKLGERGIACLRIDFRGHGDSAEPLSSFTPSTQLADMESAYALLCAGGAREVIPLGISFGAPAAIRLTAAHPGGIRRCVLIAPVTDYRRSLLEPETDWGKEVFRETPGEDGRPVFRLAEDYILGSALCREIRETDVSAVIRSVSERNRRKAAGDPEAVPEQQFLIFQGEKDPKVAFAGSEELAALYPETVKLIPLPETAHGLTAVGDEDFTAVRTLANLERLIGEICGEGRC